MSVIHTSGVSARRVDGLRGVMEEMKPMTLDEMEDFAVDKIAEMPIDLKYKKEIAVIIGAIAGSAKAHESKGFIRCGTCKHWTDGRCAEEICGRDWKEDDFCSYGTGK